ncbi:MAG: hypothetical protein ACJAUD_002226, partial [Crocinitomicaceae bacterium]
MRKLILLFILMPLLSIGQMTELEVRKLANTASEQE